MGLDQERRSQRLRRITEAREPGEDLQGCEESSQEDEEMSKTPTGPTASEFTREIRKIRTRAEAMGFTVCVERPTPDGELQRIVLRTVDSIEVLKP